MEFFETLHIETTKDIDKDKINDNLVEILSKNGYQVIGTIGRTEIVHRKKPNAKSCHEAWGRHYEQIKDAW